MHYLSRYAETLLADYDDPQAFGHTLAVMADEAEERGDAIADGLRWMAREGKRPFSYQTAGGFRWWGREDGREDRDDVPAEVQAYFPGNELFADYKVWRFLSGDSTRSSALLSSVIALAQAYAKVQAEREAALQAEANHAVDAMRYAMMSLPLPVSRSAILNPES